MALNEIIQVVQIINKEHIAICLTCSITEAVKFMDAAFENLTLQKGSCDGIMSMHRSVARRPSFLLPIPKETEQTNDPGATGASNRAEIRGTKALRNESTDDSFGLKPAINRRTLQSRHSAAEDTLAHKQKGPAQARPFRNRSRTPY